MDMQPVGGMVAALTKKWWVFLVQGIVMVLLATLAFTVPTTLIQFIGIYALVEGVLKLFSGMGPRPDDSSRWPALLIGAMSVIVGGLILANQSDAAGVLTYLIAGWAIAVGLLLVMWGIWLRSVISDEWLLILFGVLSMIFGALVIVNVEAGYLTLQWIFGAFMATGGILAVMLSFRIRGFGVRIGAVG